MRTGGRAHDSRVSINHFQELPNEKRDGLYSLHLLFSAKELALQVALFLFDVFFLQSAARVHFMHH